MMEETGSLPSAGSAGEATGLRFGVFEMDLRSGELRRNGALVRFPPQPFLLLSLLARHPGDVLTREQIRQELWPDGTSVDFDQRLNSCINQIRQILGDDAEVPRWVETLPRRGYRWLAPTELIDAAAAPAPPLPFPGAAPEPAAPERERTPARSRWLRWLHGGVTLAAIAAAAWLLFERPAPPAPASWRRVTFNRGFVTAARFGAGGEILHSGSWESAGTALFASQLSSPDARAIGGLGRIVSVIGLSRRGEIAFIASDGAGKPTLARAPAAGGARKDVLDGVQAADWLPDGSDFAVVRFVERQRRVELPVGHVVGAADPVSLLRVSPDGTRVALVEHPTPFDDAGQVTVFDRSGKRSALTERFASIAGLAWSPKGDEVWFTATPAGLNLSLFAVDLHGRRRLVLPGNARLILHDIDVNGRVLLDRSSLRVSVMFGRDGEAERELSWLDASVGVALSRDGRMLLMSESGEGGGADYATYIRPTDGAPAVRLGRGGPTDLSPDGRLALTIPARDPRQIELLPVGAGELRVIRDDGFQRYEWAGFVPHADAIVLVGAGPDGMARTYLRPLSGGPPRALGSEHFRMIDNTVSPDGTRLARFCREGLCLEWLDGSRPAEPIPSSRGYRPLWWGSDGRQLYARRSDAVPAIVDRIDVSSGAVTHWKRLAPPDLVGVTRVNRVVGTPDGRAYAYSYPRQLSELYVVEGLR